MSVGGILYNLPPTVNNMVLCTSKFNGFYHKKTKKNENKQKSKNKGKQGNREILNKSIILIVVMTSGMFVYVQTNQTVHTKYIQLIIVYQLLVDKTF